MDVFFSQISHICSVHLYPEHNGPFSCVEEGAWAEARPVSAQGRESRRPELAFVEARALELWTHKS